MVRTVSPRAAKIPFISLGITALVIFIMASCCTTIDSASLNNLLVQQYAIEKWDGKLPTYNGSSSVPFISIK